MNSITSDTIIQTFDTESIADENGINTFRIGGMYNGKDFIFSLTVEDFIINMCEFAAHDSVFYAHNTGFDVPLVFFDNPLPAGVEITNVFCIGNSLFLDIDYLGKTFSIFDSVALLPDSLKNLCYSFSVDTPKEDFDIPAWQAAGALVTDELITYNKIDCVSLYQVLKAAFKVFSELGVTEIKKTLAATSFNYFQNLSYDGDIIANYSGNLPPEVEDEARFCYCGGRTEAFYQGEVEFSGHFDFNSRYPSVQIEYEFPIFFDNWKEYTQADQDKILNKNTAGTLYCDVEIDKNIPVPPIAKKTKSGLEFPVGKFKTWLLAEEYRLYRDVEGVKINIIGGHYLETEYAFYFKDAVKAVYDRRVEAKLAGLVALAYVLKIMMNSYYGKFGMRRLFSKLVVGKPEDKEAILRSSAIDLWEIPDSQTSPIRNKQINPYVAALITAMGRYELWLLMTEIKKAGGYTVYCDTDSVFTINISADNPVIKNRIGKEPNMLSEEPDSFNERLFILGKKMWASEGRKGTEIKFKGVRAFKSVPVSEECPDGKKQLLFYSDYEKIMIGEKISIPLLKFEKFRSKSSRGKGILIADVDKRLNDTNTKMKDENGFLYPIELTEE